jgi:DNA-binding response OmpR family regulator
VILVSRQPAFIDPLRSTCDAAGLDLAVAEDAPAALEVARRLAGMASGSATGGATGGAIGGVIVDVAAIDDLGSALCDELRAAPGAADAPIVFVGDGHGVIASLADALGVGGDAWFLLPVDARILVAKILAWRGESVPAIASAIIERRPVEGAFPRVIAAAATADQLLGALGEHDSDDDNDDDDGVHGGGAPPVHTPPPAPAVGGAPRDHHDDEAPFAPDDGSCQGAAWLTLLATARRRRASGVLSSIAADDTRRVCVLRDGRVVGLSSSAAREQAASILLRLGLLTAARHRALPPALSSSTTAALCAHLEATGGLLSAERHAARRAVLLAQWLAFAASDGGRWSWRPGAHDGTDDVVSEPGDALDDDEAARALRARLHDERLWALVGGPDTVLRRAATPPDDAGAFLVRDDELRVLSHVDGARTLDDLIALVGDQGAVLRAAVFGVASGALAVTTLGRAETADAREARRTRERALVRERVLDRLARARESDYFTFLSVDEDASFTEIVHAIAALRAHYDPAGPAMRGQGELRGALVEIRDVLADAEAVLCDDELRAAYRSRLPTTATATTTAARTSADRTTTTPRRGAG